jgi:hypothetical protein
MPIETPTNKMAGRTPNECGRHTSHNNCDGHPIILPAEGTTITLSYPGDSDSDLSARTLHEPYGDHPSILAPRPTVA